MIAYARMAFPGMVCALLLASPALAASPDPNTTGPQSAPRKIIAKPAVKRHAAARSARPTAITASVSSLLPGDWQQTGMASWYGGRRWQGRFTSGGARYDEGALTAAHATLPLGTLVKVTVQGSGRSVVVLINDRPGTRSRIIDLSRGAADELGITHAGVAMVTLTRL